MPSPDQRYWLTYNGEIYNYVELKAELESAGHHFHTASDSEVILEAFRAWGRAAFERFNGMWALAIWDSLAGELTLSRDRLGVKPLFLHRNGKRLMFSSEVKAILAAEPSLARLDLASMAEFTEYPIVASGRPTYFEGIERFPPATFMTVALDGKTQERKYWDFVPPPEPLDVTLEEAATKLLDLLSDSVRLRFRSDVPVGTCLSGGLDSSSIVAIAQQRLGKAPESFSAIYDAPGFEEGEFIELMVERLGLTAHRVRPDARDLAEVMERCSYYQEEPTAGPGLYSQWHVMRIANERVKVLLDGQGSDEIFGGYFPYYDTFVDALIHRAKRMDVRALRELATAGPKIRSLTGKDPVAERARRIANRALGMQAGFRVGLRQSIQYGARRRWRSARDQAIRTTRGWVEDSPFLHDVGRVIRRALTSDPPPPPSARTSSPQKPPLVASQLTEQARPGLRERKRTPKVTGDPFVDLLWDQTTRTSIPGLLHYEDRNSMAFSIEARVPFLDYRIVEYGFQLPMSLKMTSSMTKVVLRESMRGILPEPVRERRDKKGYPTPFSLWLRQPFHHDWARELLLSARTVGRGFWNAGYVEGLWRKHLDGTADYSWTLWQMISAELFVRRFIDGEFRAEAPPARAVKEPHPPQARSG